MQSFDEFRKSIKKVSESRNYKITNSVNTISGLSLYRKNRPKKSIFAISDAEYLKIIREMNLLLVENLIKDRTFQLPNGMGSIDIVKVSTKTYFDKNDKLVSTKPIDMNATLKLWHEDEESYISKRIVRFDNDYVFRIKYNKKKISCHNLYYYGIKFGRHLKSKLKETIVNSEYDTFIKEKYNYEQIKMNKSENHSWQNT